MELQWQEHGSEVLAFLHTTSGWRPFMHWPHRFARSRMGPTNSRSGNAKYYSSKQVADSRIDRKLGQNGNSLGASEPEDYTLTTELNIFKHLIYATAFTTVILHGCDERPGRICVIGTFASGAYLCCGQQVRAFACRLPGSESRPESFRYTPLLSKRCCSTKVGPNHSLLKCPCSVIRASPGSCMPACHRSFSGACLL